MTNNASLLTKLRAHLAGLPKSQRDRHGAPLLVEAEAEISRLMALADLPAGEHLAELARLTRENAELREKVVRMRKAHDLLMTRWLSEINVTDPETAEKMIRD